MGAESVDAPGHVLRARMVCAALDVSRGGVRHRHRDRAAGGGRRPGDSEIRHAATEPHVVELCEFLQALGVGIEGAGSSTIRVEPPARLGGAAHPGGRLHRSRKLGSDRRHHRRGD